MPVPLGSFVLPQPDFSATSSQHAAHALAVEARLLRTAAPGGRARRRWRRRGSRLRVREQIEPELQRVLARRVRQLVEERLDRRTRTPLLPGARSGPVGTPERHQRRSRASSSGRSAPGTRGRSERRARRFAERHEVVLPRDRACRRVDAALEVVDSPRGGRVVLDVVLARPQQLDRRAGTASRSRRPRPCSRCSAAGRSRRRRASCGA